MLVLHIAGEVHAIDRWNDMYPGQIEDDHRIVLPIELPKVLLTLADDPTKVTGVGALMHVSRMKRRLTTVLDHKGPDAFAKAVRKDISKLVLKATGRRYRLAVGLIGSSEGIDKCLVVMYPK